MSTNIRKTNVQVKTNTTKSLGRKTDDKDDKEEKKKSVTGKGPVKTTGNGVIKATSSPSNTKRVPNSPTSSRVSKTQYYPDKKSPYSNALGTGSPKIKPSLTNSTKASVTKVSSKTPKITKEPSSDRSSKTSSLKTKSSLKSKPMPVPIVQKPKSLADVKKEMRDKLKKPPEKSKIVKSPEPDTSSSSQVERPRTATLKRPSIVSTNIAGPEATNLKKIASIKASNSSIAETINTYMETDTEVLTETLETLDHDQEVSRIDSNDTEDYEDDFDSYASDFEEYHSSRASEASNASDVSSSEPVDVSTEGEETSSAEDDLKEEASLPPKRVNSAEEERELDSGNFDLPPESHEPKRVQILDRIKEQGHEPVLSSLSDEGFEEQKSSLQFVNFAEAKRQKQKQNKRQKMTKRGEELMSMIRLDQQNFTLFDLPPQSYDVFIKSFGNRNSTQMATQTGDERVDEEVQTDVIQYSNKWTQFPIDKITKSKNPIQFREELLGVGSDTLEVNLLKEQHILEYNEYNLGRFLLSQERLISDLLKETQHGCKADMTTGKFPFSQGYLVLNTEEAGPTKLVTFSSSNKNPKVITIHEKKELRSQGFVWSLLKPTDPEDNFMAFGEVSDVTFGLDNDKLIFAGFKDGSLAVWDLLEDFNNLNSRAPSFITEVDFGSTEEVIKVLCFRPLKSNDFQVLTLNETGKIVIWELIITPTESLGLNRISLIRSNTILLGVQHQTGPNLHCTDLCLNQSDPNHFYVSTNLGVVLHSLVSGTRTNPKQYQSGLSTVVNALEGCPHNSDYFLAGCETGEVILFTKQFEKPLMTISNQVSDAAVVTVQWSRNRPCIFYTLDKDDNINIWDLSVSELYPQVTVHLKEKIRMLKVSPLKSETSYMAIVTGDGKIHLHLMNQEHGMQEVEVYAGDLRKLNNYVQKL